MKPGLRRVTPKAGLRVSPLAADLAEREKAMIENALRESGGLISGPTGAAAKLGCRDRRSNQRLGNWESTGIVSRPRSFPISFANFSSGRAFRSSLIYQAYNFLDARERTGLYVTAIPAG